MTTVTGVSTDPPNMTDFSEAPHALSPELALMAMLVENDFQLSEADRETLHAAREEQMEHMQDALEAAYDQADATRTQAWIQGGLTIAGSSADIATNFGPCESATTNATLGDLGEAASQLAQPAGSLIGGAAKEDAEAAEMAAEQAAQQAEWVADDAKTHREHEQQAAERVLQQAQGIMDTQHQATIAVLANF